MFLLSQNKVRLQVSSAVHTMYVLIYWSKVHDCRTLKPCTSTALMLLLIAKRNKELFTMGNLIGLLCSALSRRFAKQSRGVLCCTCYINERWTWCRWKWKYGTTIKITTEKQTANITCNCSVVDGELFFCDACGVGLRLRFRAAWPDCGESELAFAVVGDVTLLVAPELLLFNDLRVDGGDLLINRKTNEFSLVDLWTRYHINRQESFVQISARQHTHHHADIKIEFPLTENKSIAWIFLYFTHDTNEWCGWISKRLLVNFFRSSILFDEWR